MTRPAMLTAQLWHVTHAAGQRGKVSGTGQAARPKDARHRHRWPSLTTHTRCWRMVSTSCLDLLSQVLSSAARIRGPSPSVHVTLTAVPGLFVEPLFSSSQGDSAGHA